MQYRLPSQGSLIIKKYRSWRYRGQILWRKCFSSPPFPKLPSKHVNITVEFTPQLDEIIPLSQYAPEFCDTLLDFPDEVQEPDYFSHVVGNIQQFSNFQDIMLAHKVIDSGVPNRFGCRIPVNSNWNLPLFQSLLKDYYDQDLLEWLEFGFPVSQFGVPDQVPADCNHRGATLFPDTIDQYLEQELKLNAIMGPFKFRPFLGRIRVSPLSTRPKRDSCKHRIILDLSFPQGFSVNDGIDKDWYCGERVKLTYPTIDMLTKRVFQLGCSCRMWKRDPARAFRLLPLCPANFH